MKRVHILQNFIQFSDSCTKTNFLHIQTEHSADIVTWLEIILSNQSKDFPIYWNCS